MSVIFLTEPPIGVAPNADLPSMRSVMAASISAAVLPVLRLVGAGTDAA